MLSGILSRPESPLASLPPEVEVPLPLGFDLAAVPVVCESACGVAELAAKISDCVAGLGTGPASWTWDNATQVLEGLWRA